MGCEGLKGCVGALGEATKEPSGGLPGCGHVLAMLKPKTRRFLIYGSIPNILSNTFVPWCEIVTE
jgi:hypothetical protein